jgi:hypothetical protein
MNTGKTIEGLADVDFLMVAGKDIFMFSMEKTSLLASKIFIGSADNDEEPAVGGASLSKWLARLILTLMGNPPQVLPWTTQRTTSVPPVATPGIATQVHGFAGMIPVTLNPVIVQGLIRLYLELVKVNSGQAVPRLFAGAPFNSGDVFVRLANDKVSMQKNNFKEGKQTVIQNSKWVLKDSYYKVV